VSPHETPETARALSALAGRPPILPIVWDIALNVAIPTLCYQLSKHYVSPSELTALLLASVYPTLKSLYDVLQRGELDPVSIVVLLGIGSGIAALLFTGSYRLLLLRESLFTFAFGLACLGSLLLPSRRPLMFFFGRVFATGNDPARRAAFDASWQYPESRRGHRVITLVWGLLFVAEFAFRVVLIYTVSPATVLAVSPIVLGAATVLAIFWTFRYGARLRQRSIERRNAQSAQRP
jgi:hypothetical protein